MFHPVPSPPSEEVINTTISKPKKKRNQPGNPDPDAEVVALSPKTLMTTNRFVCEICSKGFQRDQNLQLHRRGHNLPWKLRQKSSKEVVRKKVYVCPEPSCVHSHPSRALGDLTGIKKHFCRKHGEKLWRCDKCSKKYAVMSDWKAHAKTCGTREYRCDCGTLFARKDSFLTHRAFCDALAEETARLSAAANAPQHLFSFPWDTLPNPNPNPSYQFPAKLLDNSSTSSSPLPLSTLLFPSLAAVTSQPQPELSATALLQKAACMGCMGASTSTSACMGMVGHLMPTWHPAGEDRLTRDFLGRAMQMAGGAASEGQQLLRDVYGLDLITATCQQEGAGAGSAFHPHAWGDC